MRHFRIKVGKNQEQTKVKFPWESTGCVLPSVTGSSSSENKMAAANLSEN